MVGQLRAEKVTVKCPICEKVIEIPEYDKVTRSEALREHIEAEHSQHSMLLIPEQRNVLDEKGGNPMTEEEIDKVANEVAAKVLEEVSSEILDPADRGMLLHFSEHAIEGAGLVVNEARARATPCNCFSYKGRDYCFSKGIIGMMSSTENPEQIAEYCKVGKTYEVKPGIKERFEKFAGAAEEAHK